MQQFLTGDELGNIKSLRHSSAKGPGENATEVRTIHNGNLNNPSNGVHALAISPKSTDTIIAAAYADGSASAFCLESDKLRVLHQWRETRLGPGSTYMGLAVSDRGIYSCTSNGALRMTPARKDGADSMALLAAIPSRLRDWRLSTDQETFAYGGDEVDLSVWNTERAFVSHSEEPCSTAPAAKKRKRNDALFAGEVWRAKNVPNDYLGLRQPINITSLTYLSHPAGQHHLLTGTQLGNLRRYDTRASRRPVSDWPGVGKSGGVKVVQKAISEHEVFLSDRGCNLFSFDLRNGRISYGYKGLSGTVTSIAPSPAVLATVSLDRYFRIHSISPPPLQAGQRQEQKTEVLDKVYMQCTPTVVVWDHSAEMTEGKKDTVNTEDEDIWDAMEDVGDGNEESSIKKKPRHIPHSD